MNPRTPNGVFATTHWSVVLAAGDESSEAREQALEALCRTYWYPLYAFLRRYGHAPADAEDLTQGFFAYLLEVDLVAKADPEAGRFRSFLLGSLQRWLSNQARRAGAAKRGGGHDPISLDALGAEERYALEPATDETPALRFERAWAETLVGETFRRLERELTDAGHRARFDALQPVLLGDEKAGAYADIGRPLGLEEVAVKVAVHRLRKRFGQLLRSAVAETVTDPTQVEAELRDLLTALGR